MSASLFSRHMEDVLRLAECLPDAVSAWEIAHDDHPTPEDEANAAAFRDRAVDLLALARNMPRERVETWLAMEREKRIPEK